MLKKHLLWTICAAAFAAPFAQSGSALAQGGLEEIVVTARRQEENLMQVPITISAVTADQIQNAGIKDLARLANYTPGLTAEIGLQTASSRILTFRGLATSSGIVFIDGVAMGGASAAGGSSTPFLGALDHVEVLVGPQSVYFGRSTFQGALNFVTKKPADTFGGKVSAEYGSYGTYDAAVMVEGPLAGDKLTARVALHGFHTAGQYENYSNPAQRLGERSTRSALGSFYFTPSDKLTFKVFLDHEWEDWGMPPAIALKGNSRPQFGGSGTQIPGVTGGSQEIFCPTNGTFGVYYCGVLPSLKGVSKSIISTNMDITPYLANLFYGNPLGVPQFFDTRWLQHFGSKAATNMAHLNVDYETTSGWGLHSITAYHVMKTETITSPNYRDTRDVPNPQFTQPIPAGSICCRLPYIAFILLQHSYNRDYDQEFRINTPNDWRLRGVLGVSYLKQTTPGNSNYGQTKTVPGNSGSITAQVIQAPAVFGGLYYDVSDKLHVNAETRYQSDKVAATVIFPAVQPVVVDTYKSFSPRFTINYDYATNSMAYALVSRGYRRGGFNAVLVGQPASVLNQVAPIGAGPTFAQEKLDNTEAGIKSTWLDGRARTRLTGYYQFWRNGQVPSTVSFTAANGIVTNTQLITNAGAVDLYGVEFEADWAVSEKLTLNATFNWQTSKIKNYNYIPAGIRIRRNANINGNKFWGAPQLKWTVSPTYTDHLMGDWDYYVRADWRYRGKYYADGTNLAWLPSSNIIDLRIGIKTERLSIEAYVTNLNNDRNFTQAEYGSDSSSTTGGSFENEIRLGLPNKRAGGLTVNYSF